MTPRATRREWIGLAVIALPCLLYAMDLTVLNLALPAIARDLKPTGAQLLWIVDIYGFLVAGSLITMGTLGDRVGRRKLLMIGAAAFAVASVLAAFSRSTGMLIAMRALLGVAGATVAPSTLSLIRNMFHDPRERSTAIGVWITSYSVGGAIGPLLGGLLIAHFWWGSVFLLSVPVMALVLALAPLFLPEHRDTQAGRIDLLSAGESLVGLLGIIYGIKCIAEEGGGWRPAVAISAGLGICALFVRRQRKLADPLIDLRLFRAPGFTVALLIYILSTVVAFGPFVFVAQYLQLVLGLSPLQAGLWTLPSMGGFILGSNLCPLIARRWRADYIILSGLILSAAGFALLTQIGNSYGPTLLLLSVGMYSLGLSPAFTLTTDLIVGSATPERAGAASAISETGSELGGALGIAIMGSMGLALYRRLMAGTALAGLTPDAANIARDTLSGATAIAAGLPTPMGAALLSAARAAFTRTLQQTAVISTVFVIGMAVFVAMSLRPSAVGKGAGHGK